MTDAARYLTLKYSHNQQLQGNKTKPNVSSAENSRDKRLLWALEILVFWHTRSGDHVCTPTRNDWLPPHQSEAFAVSKQLPCIRVTNIVPKVYPLSQLLIILRGRVDHWRSVTCCHMVRNTFSMQWTPQLIVNIWYILIHGCIQNQRMEMKQSW